jgi:hypothetical protein
LAHFVGFVRVGGGKQEFGHGNRVMKSARHRVSQRNDFRLPWGG